MQKDWALGSMRSSTPSPGRVKGRNKHMSPKPGAALCQAGSWLSDSSPQGSEEGITETDKRLRPREVK